MRVIIDATVFLSYLLSPSTTRTITAVISTCFTSDIEVLVPRELIEEISDKARHKQYFRERIPHEQIDQFIHQLTVLAELPPPLEEVAAYGRDPADDYLVAYGVVNEADYLVTGDPDLLVLGQVGSVQIVKPSTFLAVLAARGLL